MASYYGLIDDRMSPFDIYWPVIYAMNINTLCILTIWTFLTVLLSLFFFCLISGITKATPLKQYPQEEPNRTDPNEVITNIKSGEIKTANLNNVPISEEKVLDLCQALRNNETLTVNNSQWIEYPVRSAELCWRKERLSHCAKVQKYMRSK